MGLTKPQSLGSNFDGNIKLTDPLPVGNNKIGNVGVTGAVEVSKLPAVGITGDVTTVSKENVGFYSFNEAVTTTEVSLTPAKKLSQLVYISNDGDSDLLVGLNVATTGVQKGDNAVILLKAGEVIDNISVSVTSIKLKRTVGNGVARLLGV
ncbi:hypothetical protein EXW32_27785 (plasmid) [Bacillus mycoides]|uniref:hypothetical protein n=1 Tax=Bacillus mycoides TaxID=1405 RepID=UPI001C00FE7E|nr:hypothetical protein [Bacillus mycoides]QWG70193.1 hypothetical protein EXW32_27785 [Bacillus mycoides]